MADFNTPFAFNGERRQPTTLEKSLGLPCGPADQSLFNGLFHDIQSELGHLINFAGLTASPTDVTQVRQAIEALIGTAIGALPDPEDPEAPDLSGFLLLSQARSRLPIMPIISSSDNRINISAPAAGTVRLPGGVEFLHRGIYPITTSQTDFPTDSSKIYHLRWNPTDGFVLLDLASGTYNPTAAAETNAAFDSKFDDMLIARVITNSSNVATISNLRNSDRFVETLGGSVNTGGGNTSALSPIVFNYNLSRTPAVTPVMGTFQTTENGSDEDTTLSIESISRYGTTIRVRRDYSQFINAFLTVHMV